MTAPTGEKLALNPTGDGVRVWYTDPYDNSAKVMDVGLAAIRFTSSWASTGLKDISGLVNVITTADYDPNTATSNTGAINFAYAGQSVDCATRKVVLMSINGKQCALPNKQQLEIIWNVRDIIDELDHTVVNYPTNKLSNWGFGGAGNAHCWSSSEKDATRAWGVALRGDVYVYPKDNIYGIIPILELDPTTL